jgi:hypothetical protein
MKRQLFPLFMFALVTFGIGCESSAAQDYRQPIHIPFDFTVNDNVLKAGDYTVQLASNCILQIRDASGRLTTAVMTIPTVKSRRPEKSELIFNRYGDNYFLTQAFWGGYSTGRQLPQPKLEGLTAGRRPVAPVTVVQK